MSSSNTDKTNENKWWEVYFIRYFVGTVVGGAILLFLNSSELSSLHNLIIPGVKDVSDLDAQKAILLAALGLAFCYIASAPILVLHATRSILLTPSNSFRWTFYIGFILTLCLLLGIHIRYETNPITTSLGGAFILTISFQSILLGFSYWRKGEVAHTYYLELTKARSDSSTERAQYIESYKHLREHGNAFFILFFEVLLGLILIFAPTPNIAIVALFIWIVPATFVWHAGTTLEYRFVNPSP